jgi:Flp pilus assembly protein TadG
MRLVMFLRNVMRRDDGSAAVEAGLLLPLYMTLMVGTVDISAGMFQSMQMNAAAQAGAASMVITPSMSGVSAAMNSAAGGYALDATLTTWTVSGGVVTATATCNTGPSASCAPIVPWASIGSFLKTSIFPAHLSATATIRIE